MADKGTGDLVIFSNRSYYKYPWNLRCGYAPKTHLCRPSTTVLYQRDLAFIAILALLSANMTSPSAGTVTDPVSYTSRDLLLLTQILHTAGLLSPESVRSAQLDDIANKWFDHKCTQLARQLGEFPLSEAPSGMQISELYAQMLEKNPNCKNTTDLANAFYFQRLAELETNIKNAKTEFKGLLGEE